MRSSRPSLTEGPVGRSLFDLAAPMALGIVSILGFNLVDTWFVARLGSAELAALGFAMPVVMVMGAIGMGLGVGTTSAIARTIGGTDRQGVRRLTTDALLLSAALVAVLATVGWFAIDPIFAALGATGDALVHVTSYMRIWTLGLVFLIVPMVAGAAIRATGDTRTPAAIMVFAGLLNALLDPILIFGWGPIEGQGVAGAALASVIARVFTLVLSLAVLVGRERMLVLAVPRLRVFATSARAILEVGGPAAATNLATPLTVGLLTTFVAVHGEPAVAAFGAGARLEMLALIPVMALSTAMTPFVGQNHGAGRTDRIWRAVGLAGGFALAWGMLAWGVLWAAAGPISRQFATEPAVHDALVVYLSWVPIGFSLLGVYMIASSAFNAVGRSFVAAGFTLGRAPLLLAGAAAGGSLFGIAGLFAGIGAANLAIGIVAAVTTRIAFAPPAPLNGASETRKNTGPSLVIPAPVLADPSPA